MFSLTAGNTGLFISPCILVFSGSQNLPITSINPGSVALFSSIRLGSVILTLGFPPKLDDRSVSIVTFGSGIGPGRKYALASAGGEAGKLKAGKHEADTPEGAMDAGIPDVVIKVEVDDVTGSTEDNVVDADDEMGAGDKLKGQPWPGETAVGKIGRVDLEP